MDFNANNDREKFREKAKRFFDRQGFYVVLFFCIAILGATAYFTYRGTRKEVPQAENEQNALPANLSQDEQLLQAIHTSFPTIPPSQDPIATPVSTLEEKTPQATPAASATPNAKKTAPTSKKKTPKLFPMPVDGELMQPFAAQSLIYSKTLNQWTSHTGIDIESSDGAAVKAIDAGTVEKVENNPMLGYCISIKHASGLTSVYCNLADMPAFKKGDKVKSGDIVGNIGNTAISESAEKPHLHFELYEGDKAIDPATKLSSLSKLPSTESSIESDFENATPEPTANPTE